MKVLLCSFALVAVAVASDLSLNAQFAGFKHTHGKQYSNGIEEVSFIDFLDIDWHFYFYTVVIFLILFQLSKTNLYCKGLQKGCLRFQHCQDQPTQWWACPWWTHMDNVCQPVRWFDSWRIHGHANPQSKRLAQNNTKIPNEGTSSCCKCRLERSGKLFKS